MRNNGTKPYHFVAGERIAQLVVSEFVILNNAIIIDNSGAHEGFGSTGRN